MHVTRCLSVVMIPEGCGDTVDQRNDVVTMVIVVGIDTPWIDDFPRVFCTHP